LRISDDYKLNNEMNEILDRIFKENKEEEEPVILGQ
jgi:hypothetical protein